MINRIEVTGDVADDHKTARESTALFAQVVIKWQHAENAIGQIHAGAAGYQAVEISIRLEMVRSQCAVRVEKARFDRFKGTKAQRLQSAEAQLTHFIFNFASLESVPMCPDVARIGDIDARCHTENITVSSVE